MIIARWPEAQALEGWEDGAVENFTLVQEIVRAIRNLRAEKAVTPGKKIPALIVGGEKKPLLEAQSRVIAAMAHLDPAGLKVVKELPEKPQDQLSLVVSGD